MRLLLLVWLAGCAVKNDARYCDPATPCANPAFPYCDPVARECEATPVGGVDLAVALDLTVVNPSDDLSVSEDLASDMTPSEDLTNDDLTPPPDLMPQCTTSTTCGDVSQPICDPVSQTCRPCNNSGDDTACLLHGAGLRCKIAGTNAGQCAACNADVDCPSATPICNPDGTCRHCRVHSECTASGVCDTRPASGTNGSCVASGNVIYVDVNNNGCGSRTGAINDAYCQITDAINNLGAKTFIKVTPRATHYGAIGVGATSLTAYLVGGPFGAQPLLDTNGNKHTVEEIVATGITVNLTFDGFDFRGVAGGSNLYCDSVVGGSATLTVRNSVVNAGDRAANILRCTATISESAMYNGAIEGILLNDNSTWDIHNCLIALSAGVGVDITAASGVGTFRFNTVTQNSSGDAFGAATCGKATTFDSSIMYNNAESPPATGTQFTGAGGCTLSNVVTGTDSNTTGIKMPPVFRNTTPATLDLRLDVNVANVANRAANIACCIDKVPANGNNIDIEGDTRPKGLNADIGADEAL